MLTPVSQIFMVFADISEKLSSSTKAGREGIPPCPTSLLSEVSHLQNQISCRKTLKTSRVRNGPCRVGRFSPSIYGTDVAHVLYMRRGSGFGAYLKINFTGCMRAPSNPSIISAYFHIYGHVGEGYGIANIFTPLRLLFPGLCTPN